MILQMIVKQTKRIVKLIVKQTIGVKARHFIVRSAGQILYHREMPYVMPSPLPQKHEVNRLGE